MFPSKPLASTVTDQVLPTKQTLLVCSPRPMNELPTRAAELAVGVTSGPTTKNAVNNAGSGPPGTGSSYANEQSDESDVSLKDFLNLLSHVYQLADNTMPVAPSPGLSSSPTGHSPDWSRLADDPVLSRLFVCASQGDGELDPSADVIAILMRKLTDFLQEGILDAVLPYVVPRVIDGCSGTLNSLQRPPAAPTVQTPQSKSDGRRRSRATVTATAAQQDNGKPDFEVEIHVCDEVKNAKKDFRCPQKLLVSKMGYFAEVTVGQKLEDMDISVHCDLAIFDWLMRWVKKDLLPKDAAPVLDVSNAVPILVSAAFLRMDPLLDDCLQFCQANLNAILRSSTNLGCLNDNILSRLASLCSNTEVDNLKDKKDRIQSRLFCKLIASLSEPRPDNKRGHYASLSVVYRCQRCKQLVPMYTTEQANVPCRPDCSRLDGMDGKVYGMHVRDPSWNLTDYVRELRVELQSWRRTYWRLWADCHFQVCSMCGHLYPARLRRFCRYHVQPPQFFGINSQRGATHSIGRYSCCGQRAFRFEPIDSQSGCSFRSHQPVMRSPADEEVEKIVQAHNSLICLEPSEAPPVVTISSVNTSGDAGARKDSIWWEGLEFAPTRVRHGLLGRMWESYRKRAFRAAGLQGPPPEETEIGKASGTAPTPTGGPTTGSDTAGLTAATSTHSIDVESSPSTSSSEDNQDLASSGSSDEEESAPVRAKPSPRPSVGGSRRRRGFGRRASLAALSMRSVKDCGSLVSPPDSLFSWSEKVSTRNNQDNQRECEERAIRFMVSLLTRRTSAHHSCNQIRRHGGRHYSICNHSHCCGHSSRTAHHTSTPAGGSYLRIEAAWREEQAAANAGNAGVNAVVHTGSRLHQNTSSRPRSKAGR